MSKLLLLVQTEADVAHLPAAAQSILASNVTGVWVVFSPAITVNASEAASKLDGEITALKKAETDAAGREDYEAAKGYKTQREEKILDRAKAIRDAWKTATDEERTKRRNTIFGPFIETLKTKPGMNARVTMHSDHFDREQWVAMLNSLSGVWFAPFTPGSFAIGWPEAVETSIKIGAMRPFPDIDTKLTQKKVDDYVDKKIEALKPTTRREELEALHPMKLGPIMRTLGLEQDGLTRAQKVDAILAAEAKAPTPELAEY